MPMPATRRFSSPSTRFPARRRGKLARRGRRCGPSGRRRTRPRRSGASGLRGAKAPRSPAASFGAGGCRECARDRIYVRDYGVKRVVLPRVLNVQEIAAINGAISCETEVFVFGGLCVMAEGRCSLSSHATGRSPNMNGVCSPASHVVYRQEGAELVSRLGEFTIHRVGRDAPAPYPPSARAASRSANIAAMSSRIRQASMRRRSFPLSPRPVWWR